LPVVLCEHDSWSLTIKEEHRLRVFENRVLRRIFGPKSVEVKEGWRKLQNEEFFNLYSSAKDRKKHRWKDNIKTILSKKRFGDVD
jgi:hypothetical protein